jgi:hypothetical protein
MKKALITDELRTEYDLSKLTKVGRGLFANRRTLSPEFVEALNSGKTPTKTVSGNGKAPHQSRRAR